MKNFIKQNDPYVVPTDDMKLIEEHFGNASNKYQLSIARMEIPPGWKEPHQNPEFDEITIMIRGKKLISIDGEKVVLNPGESILVRKGARVRYSNPFEEPAEYWSICNPAFTLETVNREK